MSKGFKIPHRTAVLELNDPWLGAEFTALIDITVEEARTVEAGIDGSVNLLVKVIKAWNIIDPTDEEEKRILPITIEAMSCLPIKLVDDMVTAYTTKIRTVPGN